MPNIINILIKPADKFLAALNAEKIAEFIFVLSQALLSNIQTKFNNPALIRRTEKRH